MRKFRGKQPQNKSENIEKRVYGTSRALNLQIVNRICFQRFVFLERFYKARTSYKYTLQIGEVKCIQLMGQGISVNIPLSLSMYPAGDQLATLPTVDSANKADPREVKKLPNFESSNLP